MTKIIIADDEIHIRMLAQAIFKDMGLEVTLAVDGADAIDKIIQIKPDLIITDVIMPNKSGFEVCKFVRNSPELSHIPIILLSAMGDEYNKITGFEGGADDYITKPFNIEELKARVKALLFRYARSQPTPKDASPKEAHDGDIMKQGSVLGNIGTGLAELDACLSGGFPKGSNILLVGAIGRGKSSFSRQFICKGLENGERCLFVAIDDSPKPIRHEMERILNTPLKSFSDRNLIQFVDAYSWAGMESSGEEEPFSVRGVLELNQLSGAIIDASMALGQSVQGKAGGRRVIDSISSLLVNFDLPSAQRFITQITRTAVAFGDVTTLFILEEGTVSEQVLNNIKYVMDGIIEFGEIEGVRSVRVQSMKWTAHSTQWQPILGQS